MSGNQKEFIVSKPVTTTTHWRRPVFFVLALTVLALCSPFVYMDGVHKENVWLTLLGQVGSLVSIAALFALPFLPKRFGFRLYDFLAILMALVFAAVQAQNMQRPPPPEQQESSNEKDALALAEQLNQYARENGTETLATFFLEQIGDTGEISTHIHQEDNGATIYQIAEDKYTYKLVILPPTDSGQPAFTLTALAAPTADMRSFFMDTNGEMSFFSTKVIP